MKKASAGPLSALLFMVVLSVGKNAGGGVLPAPGWLPGYPQVDGYEVTMKWARVQGASTYHLSINGKKILVTEGNEYSGPLPADPAEYRYDVWADDGSHIEGPRSAPLVIKVPPLEPRVPTGLFVNTQKSPKNALIGWRPVSRTGHSYKVYRAEEQQGPWTHVSPGGWNRNTYVDKAVEHERTYWYRVSSVDAQGVESDAGDPVKARMVFPPNLWFSELPWDGSIRIWWEDFDYARGVKIYRAPAEEGPYVLLKFADGNEYVDQDVKSGKDYWYSGATVYRKNGEEGPRSRPRRLNSSDPLKKADVRAFRGHSGIRSIRVRWKRRSSSDTYLVWRAESEEGPWQNIASVEGGEGYSDTEVDYGKAYWYKVSVLLEDGRETAATEPVTATFLLDKPKYAEAHLIPWKRSVVLKSIKVRNAPKTNIYRAGSKDGPYELIGTTEDREYYDTAADEGTRYWYAFAGVDSEGYEGPRSEPLSFKDDPAPPGSGGGSSSEGKGPSSSETLRRGVFRELLDANSNLSTEDFLASLPPREYLGSLPFDPVNARFFEEVMAELKLTEEEMEIYRRLGFVSVDHNQRYSFPSLYYAIYARDLPVFITSDSILHALHRTFDDILREMEVNFFHPLLAGVLEGAHVKLASMKAGADPGLVEHFRDLDVYLTVARNLLAGAGDQRWDGTLTIPPHMGQEKKVSEILEDIKALKLPDFGKEAPLSLYGGKRLVDFSQFRPRGHYNRGSPGEKPLLQSYFRAMMWLGRADFGFHIAAPDPRSGIASDWRRELRDAALLAWLVKEAGGLDRMRAMEEIIAFMIGESDNFTLFDMVDAVAATVPGGPEEIVAESFTEVMEKHLSRNRKAVQKIRSQIVLSDIDDAHKVLPPELFQLFGQRYVIDSFVLSQVVFDSIIFKGEKIERGLPSGLDVMAALGNDEAVRLLGEELRKYPYAANLKTSRLFVDEHKDDFWKSSLYHIWLDALTTLDDDFAPGEKAPSVMRTKEWQLKQLQAQMASWAELRRDTILYSKQSYTGGYVCEYPLGYVEPYPGLYRKIGFFARNLSHKIKDLRIGELTGESNDESHMQSRLDNVTTFLGGMENSMNRLETLSRKELAGEPFTDEEGSWLKKTIDLRGQGSGPPRYDGWYAELYYARYNDPWKFDQWYPALADVHTDPNSMQALEVAVGDANFLVVAVDDDEGSTAYVGPVSTYYEFAVPAGQRLTDEEWAAMFPGRGGMRDNRPPRPPWTEVFRAPPVDRELERLPR